MRVLLAVAACAFFLAQVSSAESAKFKVVYNFRDGSDGAQPQSNLLAIGKSLYGTTVEGGTSGQGTLFSLDPKTGVEKVLHSFSRASGDGAYPMAGLIRVGSAVYGTTVSGGSTDNGAVFSFDLVTSTAKVVYSFQGGTADGDTPQSGLTEMGGMLYGTTYLGGSTSGCSFGCGTIFSIDPETGAETVVHFFQSNDGENPNATLTKAAGKLYGTNTEGGDGNCGTAFVFDPATNGLTVLHEFDHQGDGTTPISSLTKLGSVLYGTTVEGGDSDLGVVYGIDRKTNAEVFLHSFHRTDGAIPEGNPAVLKGTLYATASTGGSSNDGAVISLDPATGDEQIVHAFSGSDGSSPWAGLTPVGDHLYGTAEDGGSSGGGVVFEITP